MPARHDAISDRGHPGMNPLPNSIEARDAAYHMHGYTEARKNAQTGGLVIDRGEGCFIYDLAGKRYLEAMSGLWSVGLGFGEKRLVEAATRQMERLPYYHSFTHRTNGPLVDL